MEFQVEQNWGDGCKAWDYFETDPNASEQEIKQKAVETVMNDWIKKKQSSIFSFIKPTPCRPTLKIRQHKDGKRVRGGIKLTVKWR